VAGVTTEYSGTGDPVRSLALLWRTREKLTSQRANQTLPSHV